MKKVLIQNGTPALVLAPMEGVIDAPMRAMLSEVGDYSFCVSEFLRISAEIPPPRTYWEHLPELNQGGVTPSGLPVQLQLLGGDPEKMAVAAKKGVEAHATAIDLNFGCPAPTVNRHDGGAALLRFPERIRKIVEEVRKAVPSEIPVSAKLRLGWDDAQAIHLNSEMVAQGGASWITIHGRTKVQGYQPPAYWKPIGEIRKRLSIPVVANGDLWTEEDFLRCQEETQCEHFMLGRGALANPYLSQKISSHLRISENSGVSSFLSDGSQNWYPLFKRFAEIAKPFSFRSGYIPCRMKQWARMIHSRTPLCWMEQIKTLKKAEEILEVIRNEENKVTS